MRASWIAVRKLSGVAVPSCSWGSSHRDARPACHARTILLLAVAPAGDDKDMAVDMAAVRVRATARRSNRQRALNPERLMSWTSTREIDQIAAESGRARPIVSAVDRRGQGPLHPCHPILRVSGNRVG